MRGRHPLRSTVVAWGVLNLAAVTISCTDIQVVGGSPSFLIENVTLIDGTGENSELTDVRVIGNRIHAIGDLDAGDEELVDGTDLILSPGFIDTHSHHDRSLLEDLDALVLLSQGVTTIVTGQDGGSSIPIAQLKKTYEANPASINLASYVGHGSIRREIMGTDYMRPATTTELTAMEELLSQELSTGAMGFSTGLEYDPGIYSKTAEVISLARIAADHGKRYSSHMRSEDRNLFDALEETIEIGRETGIPVHISHIKLAMKSLWGRGEEVVELLRAARREGIQVTADIYPYEYWQSTMTVLFPDRKFTREAAEFALSELAPPEGILIDRYEPDPSYEGLTLAEISQINRKDPVTTYLELIARSQKAKESGSGGGESIIGTSMATEDITTLLEWPYTNVASDGSSTSRHPRGYGTFPKIFRKYVRETGELTLEEAVYKMTGLVRETLGWEERGILEIGAIADMVLFDPANIADKATRETPQTLSVGVQGVWVGGTRVYGGNQPTGAHPGKWIDH